MNSIYDYIIDYELSKLVSKEILQKYQFIPIRNFEIYMIVAIVDENINKSILEELFNTPIKFIKIPKMVFEYEMMYLEYKYEIFKLANTSLTQDINNINYSTIEVFNTKMFFFAILLNSSDIHMETQKESMIIRFRIDGVLKQIFNFEYKLYYILSSSIKLLSSLDISQKRLPQNGRFSLNIKDESFDFRVSIMPSIYGESIVIRILDNKKAYMPLEEIGFTNEVYNNIQQNINYTNGLVLITGPTGSGKTTTMYSILNKLNDSAKKIITIEDPIEYNLKGIIQININEDIGLSYEEVLKNILRQDPDILMIGEIRDIKTLQIAVQASLTGHLVFATLHTNSAIKTLNRLFDLKAEPFLISAALRMIISQKLIRILCENCKEEIIIDDKKVYKAKGCKICNLSGYIKREVLAESLCIDEKISKMINENLDISRIEEYSNYTSIKDVAYQKVLSGQTSFEEYYKNEI